jgi:hypothetical protein
MADIRFSCQQCGQHISCDEPWAGHQIQCPACHTNLIVPQVQAPSPLVPSSAPTRQTPQPSGPRLAAGVTHVARSTAHAPIAPTRPVPRPPPGENALLKYGVLAVVIAALAALGYFYGLPLLTSAVSPDSPAKPSAGAKSSQGSSLGGPMGEVSGAMDVSETLDGGGSASKARPSSTTNRTARPRPPAPPQ